MKNMNLFDGFRKMSAESENGGGNADPAAPYGRKVDGTPKSKSGRPVGSKNGERTVELREKNAVLDYLHDNDAATIATLLVNCQEDYTSKLMEALNAVPAAREAKKANLDKIDALKAEMAKLMGVSEIKVKAIEKKVEPTVNPAAAQ